MKTINFIENRKISKVFKYFRLLSIFFFPFPSFLIETFDILGKIAQRIEEVSSIRVRYGVVKPILSRVFVYIDGYN